MEERKNIVKTRHRHAGKPRGILTQREANDKSYHARYLPQRN